MLTSLQPLVDRALGIARCGQMVGQQFWLALYEISEVLLQRLRDTGVLFLPSRA